MINPLRGIYLNNRFYNYDHSSYRFMLPLRNSSTVSDNSKTFAARGASLLNYTITLAIDTSYNVLNGDVLVGATTWQGISRLNDFLSFVGANGASMPLIFVRPDGVTATVVPMGSIDVTLHNPNNLNANGCEYRISLTLEANA